MLLSLLLAPLAGAVDWPADDAWVPVLQAGTPVVDVGDADDGLDLGDGTRAALAWTATPDTIFVRIALLGPPAPGPALTDDGWGVAIDLDGDDAPDRLLAVHGTAGDVGLWEARGSGLGGLWHDIAWDDGTALDHRLVASASGGVHLDLAVDAVALSMRGELLFREPWRLVAVTFAGRAPAAWADVAGCGAPCPVLPWSDPFAVDTDDDRWPDPWEVVQDTSPTDGDVDDDGVPDGTDPDPKACDADHDGVIDPVELGLRASGANGTAADGCFRPDADPSTVTDPRVADSDGGGLRDGQEDRDGSGAVDGPYESDATDPADDVDADHDGFPDGVEPADCLLVVDCDGDGLVDGVDGVLDPDGDGDLALVDPDADDDGIEDGDEGTSDPDGDGRGAWLDLDSDGDGLPDAVEGYKDWDHDDVANALDLDSDGDRRADADEGAVDLDCDGKPDFLDTIPDDGFCDTDLPRPDVDGSPFDDPFAPIDPASVDDLKGCGCATGGRGGGLALPFLLLVARRRRR